jgi:hypothetical protein
MVDETCEVGRRTGKRDAWLIETLVEGIGEPGYRLIIMCGDRVPLLVDGAPPTATLREIVTGYVPPFSKYWVMVGGHRFSVEYRGESPCSVGRGGDLFIFSYRGPGLTGVNMWEVATEAARSGAWRLVEKEEEMEREI